MKVVITGSNGMLGSNLLKLLPYEVVGFDSSSLDITNYNSCLNILEKEKPDIIVHTAAYTNVEECEIKNDKAYSVNTIGTQNLVNYCIDKNILFVYISSTGIYGNKKELEPYSEFDDVNPTTIHHKSKYEAEKIVEKHLNRFLIIRTGWLFGGDIRHNKNFVYKRYLESKNNDIIYSDGTQIGNPTYIVDLINQLTILIDNNYYGIFNCVNTGQNISRYDYVKKIIEYFDVECKVEVATNDMFQRIAPVSNNESAKNYKLELLGINCMNLWDVSLKKYIELLKREI